MRATHHTDFTAFEPGLRAEVRSRVGLDGRSIELLQRQLTSGTAGGRTAGPAPAPAAVSAAAEASTAAAAANAVAEHRRGERASAGATGGAAEGARHVTGADAPAHPPKAAGIADPKLIEQRLQRNAEAAHREYRAGERASTSDGTISAEVIERILRTPVYGSNAR